MSYQYVSGGTIEVGNPTYVRREADEQLLKALEEGEYCYVFSASQMGKSSLRARTKESLEQSGAICVNVDFSTEKNSERWYRSTISTLGEKLKVFPENSELEKWLSQQEKTASTFFKFIDEIVLNKFETKKIYILYDEIYSATESKHSLDEFWIKIRYIYNQRSEDNRYKRLTFAFFGITTPDKLITNKSRTRLNIGTAIKLTGIKLEQAKCLLPGLQEKTENSERVLEKILYWTGGQPFLTQRLCEKIQQHDDFVTEDKEDKCIEELVNEYELSWEDEEVDSPQHFRTINEKIAFDDNPETHDALITYQKILQEGFVYESDYPDEAKELLLSGLVSIKKAKVTIFCPIYKTIFNNRWVEKKIYKICPWSEQIGYWLDSKEKNKRYLIRGKELKYFEDWAKKRRLTKNQERYLKACYRQQNNYRIGWIATSAVFVVSLAISAASLYVTGKSYEFSYKRKLQEIEAVNISSEALAEADNNLDALKEALYAKKELQPENNERYSLLEKNASYKNQTTLKTLNVQASVALEKAIYSLKEYNRFSNHDQKVMEVAISPKGNLIASGSWDSTIKLWDKDGNELVKEFGENTPNKKHRQEIETLVFSPDGQTIASGSGDNTIKLWNLKGELIRTFKAPRGHKESVKAIAFSPDGKTIVSSSNDRTVKLWNLQGKVIKTFKGHQERVTAVAFSRDGKTIVSGSEDNTIKLWSIDNAESIRTFDEHKQGVRAVTFSPDGKTIISGSADGTIKLWDLKNTKSIKTLEGHKTPIYAIDIDPDNKTVVSAGVDKTIKLWSIENSKPSATLKGHSDRIEDVVISPDGKTIISASWDSTVRLWKPNNHLSKTLVGHNDVVIGVDHGSDLIASASDDWQVKLWRKDGGLVTTFNKHTAEVYAVAIDPNGKTIVSAGADNKIKLWDKNTKSSKTIGRHDAAIWDLAISPDGQTIVSASSDNTVKIWDKHNPSKPKTLEDHQSLVWTVAISADGQTIVSGGEDGIVRLWDINGNLIKTFEKGHDAVWAVAISSKGQTIVSGGEDGKVIFWNRNGTVQKEIRKEEGLDGHTDAVKGVAISPGGEYVASASADRTIKIWDKQGNLKKTIRGHNARIWDIAFSPDGQSIVSASEDQTLIVWNLKDIIELNEFEYGCSLIQNYLKYNSEVDEEDRTICD